MKQIVATILFSVVCFGQQPSPVSAAQEERSPKTDTAADHFNRGLAFAGESDWDNAILEYSEALSLDPDNAEIWNKRGLAHQSKKAYGSAIVDFTKAIVLAPDNAVAYNNRGLTYYRVSSRDDALADFGRAIDLDPNYPDPYFNRGNVWGSYARAIEDYTKAIDINPDYAEAYECRGNAYYSKWVADLVNFRETIKWRFGKSFMKAEADYRRATQTDREKIIEDYGQVLRLNPDNAEIYFKRGEAYCNRRQHDLKTGEGCDEHVLQDYKSAVDDYTQAIRINPGFTNAYEARANAYRVIAYWLGGGSDYYDMAIDEFTLLMSNEPYPERASKYLMMRGNVYGERGDLARAIEDYTQALSLDPDNAYAHFNRGGAYKLLNDRARARADFKKGRAVIRK